jgi:hypothetical protein
MACLAQHPAALADRPGKQQSASKWPPQWSKKKRPPDGGRFLNHCFDAGINRLEMPLSRCRQR